MPRIRFLIRGRVQGVGFRAMLYDHAVELGLAGWVRNRMDGNVECVAQGPEETLEVLRAFCRRGPLGARVAVVEETREAEREDLAGFYIRATG